MFIFGLIWDCCLDHLAAETGLGLELNPLCLGLGNELGRCSPVQGHGHSTAPAKRWHQDVQP